MSFTERLYLVIEKKKTFSIQASQVSRINPQTFAQCVCVGVCVCASMYGRGAWRQRLSSDY